MKAIKFKSASLLCAVLLFSTCTLYPQINVLESARLHFTAAGDNTRWLDGYSKIIGGTYAPYQSHLSGEERDSAYVARTLVSEASIEWETIPVPANFRGSSLSFVWACGYGSNLGENEYELLVNDSVRISFTTKRDFNWVQTTGTDISLSFTAVEQNANGANLGYMSLSLPKTLLQPLIPVKIRIVGKPGQRENWYRLFAYTDVVTRIRNEAEKRIFTGLETAPKGEVIYTLCLNRSYSDPRITINSSGGLITSGLLKPAGVFSSAKVVVPREEQPFGDALSVVMLDGKVVDTIYWKEINKQRLFKFMNEPLNFRSYIFPPGDFPEVGWKDPDAVRDGIGSTELSAVYYNSSFAPVDRADKPGPYYAVISGKDKSGFEIKRYQTLYCADVDFDDYSRSVSMAINYLSEWGIDSSKWNAYRANTADYSFGDLKSYLRTSPDAAVFLSGLSGMKPGTTWNETPRIRDRQNWIKLRSLIEKNTSTASLKKKTNKKFTEKNLSVLKDTDSAYAKTGIDALRAVCAEWAGKSGVSHVTLIAHKGKIIFHEAFNTKAAGEKLTKESKLWMASITKLLTGVLVMQFADQGLINLDKPVYEYLPETGKQSKNIITTRQLMNHTSGLHFAGEWASDWNTALDNQTAQILPYINSGSEYGYNRAGYALTGKILEKLTGQAVPFLLRDHIFEPLGMTSAFCDNTYGGLYCTAYDLAKLGQMLLNKGRYNGYKLFSENSYEMMLPLKLPFGDRSWGVGTSPMAKYGLSGSAFGHGAASGSVFCVDPENQLIIISARNTPGEHHSEYEKLLIEKCVSLIKTK